MAESSPPTRTGAEIAPRIPSAAIPRASQRTASHVAVAPTAKATANPAAAGISS